ncbi:MAG: hypothetical protein RJB66_2470 [Pseudomonadota bacterium]|jgi:hypothetical protein
MYVLLMIEVIYKVLTALVGALVLIVSVTNCSLKLTPKEDRDNKVVKISGAPDTTLSLRGLQIHRYLAEISYPAGLSHLRLEVNDHIWVEQLQPPSQSIVVGFEDQAQYKVKLLGRTHPEAETTLVAEWEVTTPTDLLLDQSTFAKTLTLNSTVVIQAERVFLPPGTPESPSLTTQGQKLHIVANELIANESVIATFAKAQKASQDQAGRDGGEIFIKALFAKGDLSIVMRGEEGGDGSAGPSFNERAPSGLQGKRGRAFCRSRFSGGDPVLTCRCLEFPGDGGPGHDGQSGRAGLPGRRGGHSGQLKMELALVPTADWKLSLVKEPGLAGAPGTGGPGQLGGQGGDAGIIDDANACYPTQSKKGQEGLVGADGPSGIREPPGLAQQECLSIGEGFGRCSD